MAPAGRQGHPKATIGTPKGDIVDHNRTTPSMEEDRIYYLNWVTRTRASNVVRPSSLALKYNCSAIRLQNS